MRYTDSMLGGIRILCRGGIGYPCRCGARRGAEPARHWLSLPLWKIEGCLPSLSPAYPAFSLFSFPLSPRPPSPAGKGGIKVIFMQGAPPLASPALDRLRHLQRLSSRCQAGGLSLGVAGSAGVGGTRRGAEPARHWLSLPLWCPAGGGLPSLSPAYPAFSSFSCPLSPRPPSPVGKGETKSLFRRGLRPRHPCIRPFAALTETAKQVPSGGLAPPALPVRRALAAPCGGLNPRGTGYSCRCGKSRGACLLCRPPTPPLACFPSPYPPAPLPQWGRGRFLVFLCKGLRPLHPRA